MLEQMMKEASYSLGENRLALAESRVKRDSLALWRNHDR